MHALERRTGDRGGHPRCLRRALASGVLALLAAGALPAVAQGEEEVRPAVPERLASDVPRGAVTAFLDACRVADYDRAATHLDLRGREPAEGPSLARRFSVVLDRKLWFDLESLSVAREGDLADGLPARVERVGTISSRRGEVDVMLERLASITGDPVWKFASTTVSRVPALYDEFGHGALGEWLPAPFFTLRAFEIKLWQWLGLLVAVVAAWALAWLTARVARRIGRSIVARTGTGVDDALLEVTVGPARLVLTAAFFFVGVLALRLAAPAQLFLTNLTRAVVIVAVTWFFLRAVDGFQEQFARRLREQGKVGAVAVIPLGVKAAKTVLVLLAFIAMLQHFGFNVTGLIAGLGVGGIALALAAQKTIENLFGGVTLIADQPVRVGDFCRFGDRVGTVEDIGLRSTRVRTLDRTVVSIPNGEFSQTALENFGHRDRIRFACTLGLRYETTPDQLRHVLAEIRKLLLSHPKVSRDPARVRFVGFGAHSLDLEIFAYTGSADWNEFLAVREDLLLRIMDIVEESGSGFAFPSQTLYLGRDGGVDRERAARAEERVERWRQEKRLPFPDYDPETIDRLDGSLDYPPKGSVGSS